MSHNKAMNNGINKTHEKALRLICKNENKSPS